jgi:hypothetical protein
MNVTRAAFLQTPGAPVVIGSHTQPDSATPSSSRTRWLELAEWTSFAGDCLAFWDSVPQADKDQLMFTVDNLDFYRNTVVGNLHPPSNEDMLSVHLDARYINPHNWTITNSQPKITRRDDGYGVVGRPDYLHTTRSIFVH